MMFVFLSLKKSSGLDLRLGQMLKGQLNRILFDFSPTAFCSHIQWLDRTEPQYMGKTQVSADYADLTQCSFSATKWPKRRSYPVFE
jgi:hypothetical protein